MPRNATCRVPLPTVTVRHAEVLVGMRYVPGEFDCAHLAVLAQAELFGKTVVLPLKGPHPRGGRSQVAAIARYRHQLAEPVEPPAVPQTGDLVLFTYEGDDGLPLWHLGTVFLDGGEIWVLHTSEAVMESVLQRLRHCQENGLFVEGFYRWK